MEWTLAELILMAVLLLLVRGAMRSNAAADRSYGDLRREFMDAMRRLTKDVNPPYAVLSGVFNPSRYLTSTATFFPVMTASRVTHISGKSADYLYGGDA